MLWGKGQFTTEIHPVIPRKNPGARCASQAGPVFSLSRARVSQIQGKIKGKCWGDTGILKMETLRCDNGLGRGPSMVRIGATQGDGRFFHTIPLDRKYL